MYVDGLTRHGGAVHEGGFAWVRSNIFTVVLLMVLATTRSEVGERMKPVVEKPSSAANPPAAASTLPLESRHTPCPPSLPCAMRKNVGAATIGCPEVVLIPFGPPRSAMMYSPGVHGRRPLLCRVSVPTFPVFT